MLEVELPSTGTVVEIASGSGEHAVFFAGKFPQLTWQPSDGDPDATASIAAWRAEAALDNLAEPLEFFAGDACNHIARADAIFCANMVHISQWSATMGLFHDGSSLLSRGAPLVLYGPFVEPGVETAASNIAFDESLKRRNPAWGLRSLDDIDPLAESNGFTRARRYEMPANNLCLVYRRS